MWIRSTRCDSGQCIEVERRAEDVIAVRVTSNPLNPERLTSDSAWAWVLDEVTEYGDISWFGNFFGVTVEAGEFRAFRTGILAGEFDLEKLQQIDDH